MQLLQHLPMPARSRLSPKATGRQKVARMQDSMSVQKLVSGVGSSADVPLPGLQENLSSSMYDMGTCTLTCVPFGLQNRVRIR